MRQLLLIAAVFLFPSPSSLASSTDSSLEAGKQKASQVCANCHGLTGQAASGGNSAISPKLTPQKKEYLITKLKDYRSGKIQHPQMSLVAQMITDDDIENISAWYATIELKEVRFTQKHGMGDQADGEAAPEFENGKNKVKAVCAACHGMDGLAVPNTGDLIIPNLTAQQMEYMVQRLREYRSGKIESPVMTPIINSLSDQDIEDVSEWYSSIEIRLEEVN
jgi:cytochrome c553